ncbi:MAG TPA: malate synthase A, partial [Kribbella sp.]
MSVDVTGPINERYDEILTERALGLIETLHRAYDGRRRELLDRRRERVAEIAAGASLGFLPETKDIRDDP